MIATNDVLLRQLIIHKVGNPTRGEELRLSAEELNTDDEMLVGILKKYFISSFNENELYHFTHLSDVQLNEIFNYVSAIFEDWEKFIDYSKLIAEFLYNKSTHAKVKEGELYIVYFEILPYQDK